MNCIIVDDEPLGRKAIQLLIRDTPVLSLCGSMPSTAMRWMR